jgi:hypothetical protein
LATHRDDPCADRERNSIPEEEPVRLVENPSRIDRDGLPGHRLGAAHGDDLVGDVVLVGGALEQCSAVGMIDLRLGEVGSRAGALEQAPGPRN